MSKLNPFLKTPHPNVDSGEPNPAKDQDCELEHKLAPPSLIMATAICCIFTGFLHSFL
jgi:hypothetical protein